RRVLARPGAEYRADPIALEPAVADHLRGVDEAPVLAPCPGHDPTVRVEHVADRVDDGECADGAARSLYGPGPDAAGHRPLDAAHLPDGRPGARADPALFDGAVRRSLARRPAHRRIGPAVRLPHTQIEDDGRRDDRHPCDSGVE